MTTEPLFECISKDDDGLIDIVFIHGLTGSAHETWTDKGSGFWPEWLREDLQGICLYTLGYPAALFEKWAKKEMDMYERAANVLEYFAGHGLGRKPLIFVTHSLGGILTKMILRKSCEAEDEDWKRVSEVTKLVVFLSTPHTGAALANVLDVLPLTSKNIKLLANEFGVLEDLNTHFRSFANGKADLKTAVYYEKHATHKTVVVVTRESADPGVANTQPVALDKDHINICKPVDKSDLIYLGVKRHIQNVLQFAEECAANEKVSAAEGYDEKSEEDRRDLLQKLIDAGREHEYGIANNAQNSFARQYTKTGLFTAAREGHDILLSEIETRFITHVYHPLICADAKDDEIRGALQEKVIDPLANKQYGEVKVNAKKVLNGLYYLTEQCHIRWDKTS